MRLYFMCSRWEARKSFPKGVAWSAELGKTATGQGFGLRAEGILGGSNDARRRFEPFRALLPRLMA